MDISTNVLTNCSETGYRYARRDQVICIYSPNVIEFAAAFHGIVSIGGIVSTANPLYTAGFLFIHEACTVFHGCLIMSIVTRRACASAGALQRQVPHRLRRSARQSD